MWPMIAAGVGSLIGGLMQNDANAEMSEKNNAFNAEQARLNRDFQAEQAALQMGFQQYNSNTEYQRSMTDMANAGLNPMLVATKGGASTPTGSAASGSQASSAGNPTMRDTLSPAISTALSARMQTEQIENMDLQNANLAETQNLIRAQTQETYARSDSHNAGTNLYGTQAELLREQLPKVQQEIRNLMQQTLTEQQRTELTHLQQALTKAQTAAQANISRISAAGANLADQAGPMITAGGKFIHSAATGAGETAGEFMAGVREIIKGATDTIKRIESVARPGGGKEILKNLGK